MVTSQAKEKISFHVESARLMHVRRLQAFVRRAINVGAILLVIFVITASFWGIHSGLFKKWSDLMADKLFSITSDMGLNLKNIYLDGLHNLSNREVMDALTENGEINLAGVPILSVSLIDLKEKIEKIGWVKKADIERQLPDSLYINIVEREPIAVWQFKGELSLIDHNGSIISKKDIYNFQNLPVLVGEDAVIYANDLFTFITAEPELMERIASIILVGGRRWNVRLKNGIEIKLPEENPDDAWRRLAALQKEKNLLDRAITGIDLRVVDRMFIQVLPDDESFLLHTSNINGA